VADGRLDEKSLVNLPVLQLKSVKVCQLLITVSLFLKQTLFLLTGKTALIGGKN
jgi:hypothetical protein